MANCLVLNYHQIYKDRSSKKSKYCISRDDFEFQLNLISTLQLTVLKPSELNEPVFQDSCMLTFDDGYASDVESVIPLLNKYKLKALFFLPLNSKGISRYAKEYSKAIKHGHFVGAHGVAHKSLRWMSFDQQLEEFTQCKKEIEDVFDIEVSDFSLPYGQFNDRTLEAAEQSGFLRVFSTQFDYFTNSERPSLIPRYTVTDKLSPTQFLNILKRRYITEKTLKVRSSAKKLVTQIAYPEILYAIQKYIKTC